MPPILEPVDLTSRGLSRERHHPLAVWYGQPVLRFSTDPPFIPITEGPTAVEILERILAHPDFLNSDCTPPLVLLPELSVPFTDLQAVRDLIIRAPQGTVVVFGMGHMSEEQALSVENRPDLWDGSAAGRFANCAAVGLGGHHEILLQPKMLKSSTEKDWHWPGRVVRLFEGTHIRFAAFICSDLMNRPGNSSHLGWLKQELDKKELNLTFLAWLQHNDKPRSTQFSSAVGVMGEMPRTTVLVCGSRMATGERRYENFAVSGAFVSRRLLPSDFKNFTHRFHYVEPASNEVGRLVLLRYDADAYRVRTVLADAIDNADRAEKGELFEESRPYLLRDGTLTASSTHQHISDICEAGKQRVLALGQDEPASVTSVVAKLVALGTETFLTFLDSAIAPRPRDETHLHAAGTRHKGGDAMCDCWKHRTCIDRLTVDPEVRPLEALLAALCTLERFGCSTQPTFVGPHRHNLRLRMEDDERYGWLLYPFELNPTALFLRLSTLRPSITAPTFILASPTVPRPSVETLNAANAAPTGSIDPAQSTIPMPASVAVPALLSAGERGELGALVRSVFPSS